MTQQASWSWQRHEPEQPDVRPVPEGRKNPRAGQLMLLSPVWRVLDAQSPTVKKVSFDPAFILAQRTREGLA